MLKAGNEDDEGAAHAEAVNFYMTLLLISKPYGEPLTHRWVQVEKVMKALYVRKLYLWPRFQTGVREALEKEAAGAEVRGAALLQPRAQGLEVYDLMPLSGRFERLWRGRLRRGAFAGLLRPKDQGRGG